VQEIKVQIYIRVVRKDVSRKEKKSLSRRYYVKTLCYGIYRNRNRQTVVSPVDLSALWAKGKGDLLN